MHKFLSFPALLAIAATASAVSDSGSNLSDRVQNPWSLSFGSFAQNSQLGSIFDTPNSDFQGYGYCQNQQYESDLSFLESMGLEFGIGYGIPFESVDLRFSARVQTYGLNHADNLARPHSVFGFDALFRGTHFYCGPSIGVGFVSARTSGLTFQGAPTAIFSAVAGFEPSDRTFLEARLQTAATEAYKVASVSVGYRF